MKTSYAATLALALATLASGQVMASEGAAAKTREEVRAELREAQRTGDIVAAGSVRNEFTFATGHKLNELFPGQYPARVAEQGKTREQVRAELSEAQRTGDMVVASGNRNEFNLAGGSKLNEQYPGVFPARAAEQGKTREQVRAELREALRANDTVSARSSLDKFTFGI